MTLASKRWNLQVNLPLSIMHWAPAPESRRKEVHSSLVLLLAFGVFDSEPGLFISSMYEGLRTKENP